MFCPLGATCNLLKCDSLVCKLLARFSLIEWEINAEADISSTRERHALLSQLAESVVHAKEEVETVRMEVYEPSEACAKGVEREVG